MKIFKQAVKKIESMLRSFLLLSMMFLAVGIVYGIEANSWETFKDAYRGSGGSIDITLMGNITFEDTLIYGSQQWTSVTVNGNNGIKTLNANYNRGFIVSGQGKQLTLNNVRYETGWRSAFSDENNHNGYGGAVEIKDRAHLILSGNVTFFDNRIEPARRQSPEGSFRRALGGAIGLHTGSLLTVEHSTVSFIENQSEKVGPNNGYPGGGAIYLDDKSYASFVNSSITFRENSTAFYGTAFEAKNGSSVTFINSNVDFIKNWNGAVSLEQSTMVFKNSVVTFTENVSDQGGDNGAIIMSDSAKLEITENSVVTFSNNYSALGGGAIRMLNTEKPYGTFTNVEIEDAHFTGNEAAMYGGAILTGGDSNIGFRFIIRAVNRSVIFSNNKADGLSNDIFLTENARILFDAASNIIELQGGIIADAVPQFGAPLGNVNITKQGAGELILSGRNQLRGTLDIQEGKVTVKSGELFDVSLTNLTVANAEGAAYSTIDDKTGQATYVENANLLGTVALDVDFDNANADKISATAVTVGAGTKIQINGWGSNDFTDGRSSIAVVISQQNIGGSPTSSLFEFDVFGVLKYEGGVKDNKVLFVYMKPPQTVNSAEDIRTADGSKPLKIIGDITAESEIGISNNMVIYGEQKNLNGGNNTGFNITGNSQVEINDLNFSDFKGSNGKAIIVNGSDAELTIAANKSDVIFKDNTIDLDLQSGAQATVKGNKNVIFNGKVVGIAGSTLLKSGNGSAEFKGEINLAGGTLEIKQGYVKQTSTNTANTVGTLKISGGAIEFGDGNYIIVNNLLDINPSDLDSWVSITENVKPNTIWGIVNIENLANAPNIVGSTMTVLSADGRYETEMWVDKGNITPSNNFIGTSAGIAPHPNWVWAHVIDRNYFGGDLSIGGISLSGAFIANALRENAKANAGAIYSNFDKTAWASFNFDGASVSDDENFGASGFGGQAGYKFYNSASVKAGVFAGFGSKNFKQGTDEGSMSEFGFGIYGGYFSSSFGLKGFAGLGIQSNELKNGGTKAEFDSTAIRFGAEAEFGAGLIKPFAGFEAGLVSNPDIDVEVDGQAAATIDANSFMRFALLGGVKLAKKQDKLSYFGKGYLGFLLAGGKPEYNSSVKISDTLSASKTIDGSDQQAVYLGLGAGIDYAISSAVSLFVNIDTKVNADIFDYQGNVGASFKF